MKITKDRIIFLIVASLILVFSSTLSTYATNYFFKSNEVSYDNSESNVKSNNVQGAIDKLYEDATDYTQMRQMIYPVGSIYISVTDDTVAKVEARFGGTWEKFGEGETLVGVNSSDTNFDTIEETGGTKTENYTPGATIGNTTLTAAQSGLREHSHDFTNPTYSVTGGAVTNGITGGSHSHTSKGWAKVTDGSGSYVTLGGAGQQTTYSTNASTHTHNLPAHTHTVTVASNGAVIKASAANATASHTHTFTGTQATISHLQPYITVYMYKRVS